MKMKYSKFTSCKNSIDYNTSWIKLLKLASLKAVNPFLLNSSVFHRDATFGYWDIAFRRSGWLRVVCFSLDQSDLSLARLTTTDLPHFRGGCTMVNDELSQRPFCYCYYPRHACFQEEKEKKRKEKWVVVFSGISTTIQ